MTRIRRALGDGIGWLGRRPWLIALVVLAVAATAWARPGGGGSFSSGGGSSGSDTLDGIELFIDLIVLIVELVADYPQVMIPLLALIGIGIVAWRAAEAGGVVRWILGMVAVAGFVSGCIWVPNFILVSVVVAALAAVIGIWVGLSRKKAPEWNTTAPPARPQRVAEKSSARAALDQVRKRDPEFSLVLFQDYLYAFYGEVMRARAAGQLGRLTPFISGEARNQLKQGELKEVKDLVIGALRLESGAVVRDRVKVSALFDVNLTEVGKDGHEHSYYAQERWKLSRKVDAKSRPPAKISAFDCPNCGAALDAEQGRTCRYCKQEIDGGQLDWLLTGIDNLGRSEKGPQLTSDVEEQGTDAPTVVDRELAASLQALQARDPAFSLEGLQARVQVIFATFQKAWAGRDLTTMRPYLSDRLYSAQQYWVDAYKRAKLRNITDKTRIIRFEPARVLSDKQYDAVTLRVFATGLDYTVDEGGKKVSGSDKRERAYSEYWTLIRGAARTGAARTDAMCPNCGAELKINMAGNCEFCRAKLTAGEFDWVLSQIEQDEVYGG